MHANARLTPIGRLTLCLRIEGGRPVAHVAPEMGISRATGYKWWRRFCEEGVEGLVDRSSRPHCCPHRTAPGEVHQYVDNLPEPVPGRAKCRPTSPQSFPGLIPQRRTRRSGPTRSARAFSMERKRIRRRVRVGAERGAALHDAARPSRRHLDRIGPPITSHRGQLDRPVRRCRGRCQVR